MADGTSLLSDANSIRNGERAMSGSSAVAAAADSISGAIQPSISGSTVPRSRRPKSSVSTSGDAHEPGRGKLVEQRLDIARGDAFVDSERGDDGVDELGNRRRSGETDPHRA